jgi:putative transcriptional regulator
MKIILTIDRLLYDRGMSQHELSRLTGIRQPSINEMCRNHAKRPPLDNLAKICEALDCDITDIMEFKKEHSD